MPRENRTSDSSSKSESTGNSECDTSMTFLPMIDEGCFGIGLRSCCLVQCIFRLMISMWTCSDAMRTATDPGDNYGNASDRLRKDPIYHGFLMFAAAFSVTQCLTCLPYLYGLITNRPRLIQPYVTSLYPTMAVEGFVGVAKADSTILMYIYLTGLTYYMRLCAESMRLKLLAKPHSKTPSVCRPSAAALTE